MTVNADGTVRVSGGKGSATPDALVVVDNVSIHDSCSTCNSAGAEHAAKDGSWQVTLPGKSGDQLEVLQWVGTETSSPADIIVP